MTLTRRRVRVSKYIAQVNHMGTDMGTKFMLLYFIYIKQLVMTLIGLMFTLRFTLKSIIYLKTQPMGPMVDK